jgi:hypothetical protein
MREVKSETFDPSKEALGILSVKGTERTRRYYEYLDSMRDFYDRFHVISQSLIEYIETNVVDENKEVSYNELISQIEDTYNKLPNRYKQLVDFSINKYLRTRKCVQEILRSKELSDKLTEKIQSIINVKVFRKDMRITPLGLEITIEDPRFLAVANGAVLNLPVDFIKNSPLIYIDVLFLKNSPDETLRQHETEHLIRFHHWSSLLPGNIAGILSRSDIVKNDSIPLDLLDEQNIRKTMHPYDTYNDFETGIKDKFLTADLEGKTRFLKEVRSYLLINLKAEMLAISAETNISVLGFGHYVKKEYLTEGIYIPGVSDIGGYDRRPYIQSIFDKYCSNTECKSLWDQIMKVEFNQIVMNAYRALTELIVPKDDRLHNYEGVSPEKARTILSMYPLEDWGKVVKRYNTREYSGLRIEAPEVYYEKIKRIIEIFKQFPGIDDFDVLSFIVDLKFNPLRRKFHITFWSYSIYKNSSRDLNDFTFFSEDLVNTDLNFLVMTIAQQSYRSYKLNKERKGLQPKADISKYRIQLLENVPESL